jgi:2-polyprenyl-3-methyl-5-hydroxy-6-metoxy-1,4-benzoquinol methylase
MLRQAEAQYPALATRLTCDTLPNLASVPDASYDGILCWAVLMHLPEEFLFDTAFNLRRILKPGGRLLISTPLNGPATDPDTHRDPDGRLFNGVTPENFHFLLEKVGFHRINRWDEADTLGRKERRWATQLFVSTAKAYVVSNGWRLHLEDQISDGAVCLPGGYRGVSGVGHSEEVPYPGCGP